MIIIRHVLSEFTELVLNDGIRSATLKIRRKCSANQLIVLR